MAYTKLLSPDEIVKTALHLLEQGGDEALSLRAVAGALGVKAPSLYRYFPQKDALEVAVAEAILQAMAVALRRGATVEDAERRLRRTVDAYLSFARRRFAAYSYVMQRVAETYHLAVSKTVWNLLLDAVSGATGRVDDTAGAVAVWSLLHGFAVLEQSGAFGASGPHDALERALAGFVHVAPAPLKRAPAKRSPRAR